MAALAVERTSLNHASLSEGNGRTETTPSPSGFINTMLSARDLAHPSDGMTQLSVGRVETGRRRPIRWLVDIGAEDERRPR